MRGGGLLMAAALAGVAGLVSVSLAADEREGREVYDLHCAVCHGPDGRSLDPAVPSFADGDALFLMDADIMRQISDGKGTMPAFRGLLTPEEMRDVIAYIRTF